MNGEPIYPQDFDEEQFIAEQQAVANEQYQAYLRDRGITEEEHLVEVMQWCDQQD